MRKTVRNGHNVKRKMSLVLVIVILFNLMIPNYSNAVIGISILSKPIASIFMLLTDSVNGILAAVFATDAKIEGAIADSADLQSSISSSNKLLEKILQSLDKCEEAYYNLLLSPDDIFSGKVQITNANIFSDKFDENGSLEWSDINLFNHLMKQLKQTTAGLYYTMRNLAVVILLCLLIYSGIRIILASNNSGEKAKWKMYLMDWVKALALVMFIHFIMIGIFYIAEVVTGALCGAINSDNTLVTMIRKNFNVTSIFDAIGVWVYVIMYIYVTYLTIVFLVAYFKRLFYIIVLIIISPIMSALYALGKTSKAQFNTWLQEFTFGVMVQPFHLLVYSVLLAIPMQAMGSSGASVQIGGVNVWQMSTIDVQIYALMAIAMIRPIEKYLRKIFGFGKTMLDNVASFESGKKTLDAGVKVVKEVVKDTALVAATVVTAGAAAPALAGAAGAGAAGAGAGGAGAGAGAAAGGAGGAGAGAGAAGAGAEGAADAGAEGAGAEGAGAEGLGGTGGGFENGLPQSNSSNSGEAEYDDDSFDGTESDDNGRRPKKRSRGSNDGNESDGSQGEQSSTNKGVLQGENLARALGGKLDGIIEAIQGNSAYKVLTSPETRDKLQDTRASMHEFVDSLYIVDPPKDWQVNVKDSKERISKKKEKNLNQFINNPKNIQKVINKYDLKDKVDSKTGEITTAEQQAKEKLKGMEPYVSRGIDDIDKIYELQKTGLEPKEAMRTYLKETKQETKVKNFITNYNNVQQLRNIIADRMNIPDNQRNDINVIQQIDEQVRQEFNEGAKYIASGAAKDSATLDRLVNLERKIDEKLEMRGTTNYSKENYIVNADKIIGKALEKRMKNIKLPKSDKNADVKILQDILNKELKKRRGLGDNDNSPE